MGQTKSIAGQAHALQIMLKVIEYNKPLDVVFSTEGMAKSFRFQCYSARRKEREARARYENRPISEILHPFDKINCQILPTHDGKFAVRIYVADIEMLEIRDTETGEVLSLTNSDAIPLEDLMSQSDEE